MTDSRLDAYLDGQMSPEEIAGFEADLARNAALQTELETQKAARAAVHILQRETLRQQLREAGPPPPPSRKIWLWGLLGLTVLLLSLALIRHRVTNDFLFDRQCAVICQEGVDRNRGARQNETLSPEDPLADFCELMAQQEAQRAIEQLTEFIDVAEDRALARVQLSFALATAYGKAGNVPKAKELLERVVTQQYDYQREAKQSLATLNGFWRRVLLGS